MQFIKELPGGARVRVQREDYLIDMYQGTVVHLIRDTHVTIYRRYE